PFPDARRPPGPQGVDPGAPAVEVADDAHVLGVGGPHREAGALLSPCLEGVGAQLQVQAAVGAFVEQVQVIVGEQADVVAYCPHPSPSAPGPSLRSAAGGPLTASGTGW